MNNNKKILKRSSAAFLAALNIFNFAGGSSKALNPWNILPNESHKQLSEEEIKNIDELKKFLDSLADIDFIRKNVDELENEGDLIELNNIKNTCFNSSGSKCYRFNIGEIEKKVLFLDFKNNFNEEGLNEILECFKGTGKSNSSRAKQNLKQTLSNFKKEFVVYKIEKGVSEHETNIKKILNNRNDINFIDAYDIERLRSFCENFQEKQKLKKELNEKIKELETENAQKVGNGATKEEVEQLKKAKEDAEKAKENALLAQQNAENEKNEANRLKGEAEGNLTKAQKDLETANAKVKENEEKLKKANEDLETAKEQAVKANETAGKLKKDLEETKKKLEEEKTNLECSVQAKILDEIIDALNKGKSETNSLTIAERSFEVKPVQDGNIKLLNSFTFKLVGNKDFLGSKNIIPEGKINCKPFTINDLIRKLNKKENTIKELEAINLEEFSEQKKYQTLFQGWLWEDKINRYIEILEKLRNQLDPSIELRKKNVKLQERLDKKRQKLKAKNTKLAEFQEELNGIEDELYGVDNLTGENKIEMVRNLCKKLNKANEKLNEKTKNSGSGMWKLFAVTGWLGTLLGLGYIFKEELKDAYHLAYDKVLALKNKMLNK